MEMEKMNKYKLGVAIGLIFVTILAVIAFTFIYAAIGCALWGAIVVPVFGLPALTYWQFFGIMILIRCFIPINVSTRSSK